MRDTSVSWQKILAQGFSSATELLRFLELPPELADPNAESHFATRVPLGFAKRMQKGMPDDPLLMQVLAVRQELDSTPGFSEDAVGDLAANPLKGLIHKYHGRVLVTLTGACAVNCRFCFRRHFPYQENNPGRLGLKEIADYIAADPTIHEVILSGGDPLLASNQVIREFIGYLEQIPQVHTLRIHTRIPIVLPERIDAELVSILAKTPLKKVMVLHCNHVQELDDSVKHVCDSLRGIGCHILNQTVLLAGINDQVDSLTLLNQTLFSYGIMPYYLHVLDKVSGTAHYDMPLAHAKELHRQIQSLLPGYLVPRLVREDAGKPHKTLVNT